MKKLIERLRKWLIVKLGGWLPGDGDSPYCRKVEYVVSAVTPVTLTAEYYPSFVEHLMSKEDAMEFTTKMLHRKLFQLLEEGEYIELVEITDPMTLDTVCKARLMVVPLR